MFGLLKGLSVTVSQIPKKKYTLMYPDVKPEWPDRFRGVHKFYPELCIVCNQCAKICPTSCISLSGSRGEDKKLHIETYDINFEICILCDLCTEVCPTEAVQMTDTFELAEYNRDALYKNIEWLSTNGRQHDERKGFDQDNPSPEWFHSVTPDQETNNRVTGKAQVPGGIRKPPVKKPEAAQTSAAGTTEKEGDN